MLAILYPGHYAEFEGITRSRVRSIGKTDLIRIKLFALAPVLWDVVENTGAAREDRLLWQHYAHASQDVIDTEARI